MNDDSTNQYSFLLHAIEGRLDSPTPAPSAALMSSSSPGGKRPRLSGENTNTTNLPSLSSSSSHGKRPRLSGETSVGLGDRLQLLAELDEARLVAEQLRDKARAAEDELGRHKEKATKQLLFLESEITQLRKEARERTDQYYEEKKKWQAKLRAVEADLDAARSSAAASSSSSSSSSYSSSSSAQSVAAATSSSSSGWESRLTEMERSVKQKAAEMNALSKANAELEERCSALRRDLILAQAKLGETQQAEDEALETRDMKKRCGDLEVALRRKTREADRLEQKVQNQALLEEELAAANVKLKLAQDAFEAGKSTQASYHALAEERKEWALLFQNIVLEQQEQPGGGSGSSVVKKKEKKTVAAADISPAMVLRTMSATQKQCVVLLKAQGELETTVAELRKQVALSEASAATAARERDDKAYQGERLTSRLALAQQQAKLFEGEVASLRALLKSFDAEFQIGSGKKKNDDALVLKKDEVIAALRKDLDTVRLEACGFVERLDAFEQRGAAAGAPAAAGSSAELSKAAQGREDALKEELVALQIYAGVDFVPGATKVLHLIDNPCAAALGSRAQPAASSVPREQVKRLRGQVRQLEGQVAALAAADPDAHRPTDVDQSMNMSTAAPRPVAPSSSSSSSAAAAAAAADSNKLNQRLKEMFKERITSFREAVYLLTGYKVDLYAPDAATGGHARLRLRSMYAEDPDDSLLFQWKGETLELMETPFAGKLNPKLFAYLSSCNSVPAFLANVTLELFDNQTFLGL